MTGSLKIIPWDGKPITKPGVYSGIPLEDYHRGDICDGPNISSTGLRAINNDSPAHYWCYSPLNPERFEQPKKKHFEFGKAAHTLLLGDEDFSKNHAVRPAKWTDWTLKASREWRQEQWDLGKTVITLEDLKSIEIISKNLTKDETAKDALIGHIETSIFWKDPVTRVWLKARPDSLSTTARIVADLKFPADIRTFKIEQSITKFGYHMQLALIGEGIRNALGVETEKYVLVCCGKTPPYIVHPPIILSDYYIQIANYLNREAINKFAECLETGHWPGPGYDKDLKELSPPDWLENSYENEMYIRENERLKEVS